MAHYYSRYIYYEDEGKISLKSISMKRLVFASYAQFGVNAGFEVIMGARNGIRPRPIFAWRPEFVKWILEKLYDPGFEPILWLKLWIE